MLKTAAQTLPLYQGRVGTAGDKGDGGGAAGRESGMPGISSTAGFRFPLLLLGRRVEWERRGVGAVGDEVKRKRSGRSTYSRCRGSRCERLGRTSCRKSTSKQA